MKARKLWSRKKALEAIQSQLSNEEWSADTCDEIAAIMRKAGYEIHDTEYEGSNQAATPCQYCGTNGDHYCPADVATS